MRRTSVVAILALIFCVSAPLRLCAQGFDWYRYAPYNARVPCPDSLLGHAIGTRHTMSFE